MIKRCFDLIAAAVALLVLSPLLAVLALVIRIKLGHPVVFTQVRPGRHGRPFRMYKFRSMTNTRGADGELLPDALRLTSFGRKLRSTSLDELPELINILRGEMSFVGPRPLLLEYLPLYSPAQARRHDVRPGLTGWAQVKGRNSLSWEEKFELDQWYVDHASVWLDCRILFMTARAVLKRDGIAAKGEATMPLFRGSPETQKR